MYPPEPSIGYGIFNGSREITPGFVGPTTTGFGIINPPKDFFGVVTHRPDNQDLIDYLAYAKTQHLEEKRAIDWEAVPNKFAALVGLEVRQMSISSDNVSFLFRQKHRYSWGHVNIHYGLTAVCVGILEASEVMEMFYDAVMIESVEDEIITVEGGRKFALLPRYLQHTNSPPVWVLDNIDRNTLMENLNPTT